MTVGEVPRADDEFDEAYFRRMEGAGDHWWVRGMREVGAGLLPPLRPPLDVLDLGCGSGASLRWLDGLRGGGTLHGSDIASAAVRVAAAKGIATALTQASMRDLPYRDGSFDLVVNADVLQHLKAADAVAAAAEVRRVLRPGGRFLVRVNGDSFRGHVREEENWRLYSPGVLRRELEAAGLDVDRLSYANSLPSLAAVARTAAGRARGLVRSRSGHHDHHDHGHDHDHDHHGHDEPRYHGDGQDSIGIPDAGASGALRDALGRGWLRAEAAWLRRPGATLPFGHAVVAVARRPA